MLQANNATVEEQSQHMANLNVQIQELCTQLESVTAQLTALQSTVQQLTSVQQQNNNNNNNRCNQGINNRHNNSNSNANRCNNNNNHNNQNRPRTVAHCWTHRGIPDPFHTSQTCMYPAPGHVREATLQDM